MFELETMETHFLSKTYKNMKLLVFNRSLAQLVFISFAKDDFKNMEFMHMNKNLQWVNAQCQLSCNRPAKKIEVYL